MLNIGTVDISGLDVKADIGWRRGDWTLQGVLRYSLEQALDHSTPGSATWGNQIPYIPLHSGSLSLEARWKSWSLGWDCLLTGERWSRTANTPDYHIDPWCTADTALSYEFEQPRIGLSLRVRNLFNEHYQIVQGYPMPGTNFLLSVTYQW
jgi:outer membrane receptor protein involved in Fe transport